MQVMFVGNPHDEKDGSGGVEFYGVRFALNKVVDVSHLKPAHQDKLAHNNHFKVIEAAPAAAAPVTVAALGAAPSAPVVAPSAPAAVEEPRRAAAPPPAAPPTSPAAAPEAAAKPAPRVVRANKT